MKKCIGCKYAEWKLTVAGKLHPSGDGMCGYKYKVPPTPACMYWIGNIDPKPSGGAINRRRETSDHCPYWQLAVKVLAAKQVGAA